MAYSRANCSMTQNDKTHVIDLRSDVLTQQSPEMKAFMMSAEVGDDVFQEDPTTIALEHKVADMLQKEAALFVLSGTMGNLLCVMTHCDKRGSEILLGNLSHIHLWEQGNISQLGGVHSHLLKNLPDGTFDLDELKDSIRVDNIHLPSTRLVCIENTHNQLGGKVLPIPWLDELGNCCRELGLPIHVDAARLMNAAVALDVPPARLVRDCTSACLCLSKGLGAPVGSVIAGPRDFIERARRLRKALGGGVRQPGMLAAAGIYGLDHVPKLLWKDHAHAKAIAKAVSDLGTPLIRADVEGAQTNILLLECDMKVVLPNDLCSRLMKVTQEEESALGERIVVKSFTMAKTSVRFVLYFNVTFEDVQKVIRKLAYIIKEYEGKV
ncbi:uncharacterized protein [Macrobrachium rosenbergii]|uniref:uncharacterized protein n=1 Tax=Macrobrachium rosenbergii TaxID=79674 RepID=UPI0034D4E432